MSLESMDALEERIGRVVELVKGLKADKTRLEGELAGLEAEVDRLRQEKEEVKGRLENILRGIENLNL